MNSLRLCLLSKGSSAVNRFYQRTLLPIVDIGSSGSSNGSSSSSSSSVLVGCSHSSHISCSHLLYISRSYIKIRMQRTGRKNLPHYRIVVANTKSPRDGKFIEKVFSKLIIYLF